MSDRQKTKAQLIEELQQLRQQVAVLQAAQDEPRQLEVEEAQLLRTVVDTSPDWTFVKDRQHRFRLVNRGFADLLGRTPEACIGKNDLELGFPEEMVKGNREKGIAGYWADDQQVMESGEPLVNPYEPATLAGKDRVFHTIKTPLWDAEGDVWGLLGIVRDVTPSKQMLDDLDQRSNQLRTAAEVSRAATAILDPEELIQQAVDLVQERFGLYYVGLFLVDQTGEWTGQPGKWAVLRAGSGEAGQLMLAAGHKLQIGGESMIGWCVANQQARIALDVGEEGVHFDNPFLPATRSEIALPLIARGQVIGAMTVQSEEQAAFEEEDVAVLQTMADQLANAIQNARLFGETQQRLQEQAMLFNASQELASASLQPEQIATIIACQFVEVMNIPECSVSLLDPEQGTLRILADFYIQETQILREKVGESFRLADYPATARALQTLQPLVVQASDAHADPAELSYMQKYGVLSLAIIPMAVKGQAVGVIELEAWDREHHYTPEQLNLAMTLANQAAVALENARLFEQTQAALAEVEATHRLYLRREWQAYLRQRETLSEFGYLYDRAQVVAEADLWRPEMERVLSFGGVVATQGDDREGRTAVAVPIVLRGQTVGVLGLEDPNGTRQWSEEDQALVEAISRQLALTLENTRLMEETQRRAAREQLISQVIARMRETLDVDTVLNTAAHEMRQALGLSKIAIRLTTLESANGANEKVDGE